MCGSEMKLVPRKNIQDGYQWECQGVEGRREHITHQSIRNGSWFSKSKIKLVDILMMTHFWAHKCSSMFIMHELGLSKVTVVKWRKFCRGVCLRGLLDESCVIGGENQIVEIDESKFGKRRFHRGKWVEGVWVFVGVQRGSRKSFFRVVPSRNKDTLLAIIKESILPGTTIISDCWKSYDCLKDEGYVHLTVNHSITFKDKTTGAHTNSCKGTWSAIKRGLPASKVKDQFETYLAEYMWRRSRAGSSLTEEFLKLVGQVYAPMNPRPDDEASSSDDISEASSSDDISEASSSDDE
jgi:transposase-like protein